MTVKSSPIVHALPYPALESGNLSFPQGLYEPTVNMRSDGYSIEIEHRVSGVPFIEKLIEAEKIGFYCLFSSPKSGIRKLYKSEKKGKIDWSASIVGEPPKLRPMLIYTGEDKEYELTEECGVDKLWQGKKIILPKGARLARGSFLGVDSSEHNILKFRKDENYKRGSFGVEVNTEGGFYFLIKAAPDVHNFVNKHRGVDNELWDAILTGIVARCFSILQTDYKESDDDSNDFSSLKILSAKLEQEYGCDWNDESFDPMEAATKLYPVRVPSSGEDTEEDE